MWTTFLSALSHIISMGNFISFIQKLRIRGLSYGNSIPSLDRSESFIERPFLCSSAVSATSASSLIPLIVTLILFGSDSVLSRSEFRVSSCAKASLHKSLKLETAKRTTNRNRICILNSRTLHFLDMRINWNNAYYLSWQYILFLFWMKLSYVNYESQQI
jgi:hypothetical protein